MPEPPAADTLFTTVDPISETPPTAEAVFRDHAPRIYHLARRMLGNDADAEDVTQDVLLQVIRKLHTFRGDAALSTWLHRVTVNAALAHREKRANRQKHESAAADEATLELLGADEPAAGVKLPRAGASPAALALAAEQRDLIDRAIRRLPEPFRDVFVLADVEGM
ncbi:MAG: RNA polymerase sigma factor, partial [Fimbriiglobus sp.]